MATAPTLLYLQLDAAYDPIFDVTASLTNLDAVTQAIQTRLNLWLGEWWERLNDGLPVFQQMLGQLGSAQGLAAMELSIQQRIQDTPYVTSASVSASFTNGVLKVNYTATTQFGTVTGSTAVPPGLSAAEIGG